VSLKALRAVSLKAQLAVSLYGVLASTPIQAPWWTSLCREVHWQSDPQPSPGRSLWGPGLGAGAGKSGGGVGRALFQKNKASGTVSIDSTVDTIGTPTPGDKKEPKGEKEEPKGEGGGAPPQRCRLLPGPVQRRCTRGKGGPSFPQARPAGPAVAVPVLGPVHRRHRRGASMGELNLGVHQG